MKSAKNSKSPKSYSTLLESICLLTEGKIDDLKAQNPGLHHEIDQYAAADTSATKKFLPWLVAQHKRGNVTPDHPNLHQTIQNFDRYRNIHGIKDHSNRSFQEVRDTVVPLVGGPSTKKGIAEAGREKIHDSGGVQAYHIKTKEASQHFYGGGPEAGPTNTTWCVSARSPECLFEKTYGEMYTIHVKGDSNSPYAVHPKKNIITNRHNDGERDIDKEIKRLPEIAKLKSVINTIKRHYDPVTFRLKHDSDISDKEINDTMNGYSNHKIALVSNPNPHIVLAALKHPEMDAYSLETAVRHPDRRVAMTALHHQEANNLVVANAAEHPDSQVVMSALNHPYANKVVTRLAAQHPDPQVRAAAQKHLDNTKRPQ